MFCLFIFDKILVSFKDAESRIEKAKKIVYTGTPVKIEKREYSINQRNEIIKSVGLSEVKPIILVFGGSQGAQKINEAIIGILTENLNKNYQIMWATGPKQYEIIKEEGPDHDKHFYVEVYHEEKCLGRGIGKSKKEAEQDAAHKALNHYNS